MLTQYQEIAEHRPRQTRTKGSKVTQLAKLPKFERHTLFLKELTPISFFCVFCQLAGSSLNFKQSFILAYVRQLKTESVY